MVSREANVRRGTGRWLLHLFRVVGTFVLVRLIDITGVIVPLLPVRHHFGFQFGMVAVVVVLVVRFTRRIVGFNCNVRNSCINSVETNSKKKETLYTVRAYD